MSREWIPDWWMLRHLQDRVNQILARQWLHGGGEPQWFGPGPGDGVTPTPDPLHLAALRTMGREQWGTPTPTEGQPHPVMPHSVDMSVSRYVDKATEETEVTEPVPDREPTPEEYRAEWCRQLAILEGYCLKLREYARAAVRVAGAHADPVVQGVMTRGYLTQAWAADRLLDDLRDLVAPPIPVDDEKGQGSILELVRDTPEPEARIGGHVMACHSRRSSEDWTCTCPEDMPHPCGCPAGTTAEEHAENHSPDTPGGY